MSREISIQYYAILQEKRGLSIENITTEATTPRELYRHLQQTYDFPLEPENMAVAVNHALTHWDTSLQDQDTVVFLPPIARG